MSRINRRKLQPFPAPIFENPSDPHSPDLSPDAVQLATSIGLMDKFRKLKTLQAQLGATSSETPVGLRQDIADLKLEIIEIIEQTRLDIDFVTSELAREESAIQVLLTWYTDERDNLVNSANKWSFRTNGVLWAIAEGLSIPGYKYPNMSIPSGSVGIVAGVVPMLMSGVAMRAGGGFHYHRDSIPNMLSKFYDLPTVPRIEYPDSIWTYLNLPPAGESARTRRDILLDHWQKECNVHTLKGGLSKERIAMLAGVDQSDITIDLLNDRLKMLREVAAYVRQMTRPLMEINMCLLARKTMTM